MRSGIRLGRVFGAPVVADASAFVLAVIFGIVVLIDIRTGGAEASADWVVAVVGGFAAIATVFAHEASHAAVASFRGLRVRAIRLYLFGGYSVIDGSPTPATEALVALAGPAGSAILSGVLYGLSAVVGQDSAWGQMLFALALLNIAIALFNLIPGFPLDGGRILRGALMARGSSPASATQRVTMVGQVIGYIAMGAGIVVTLRLGPIGLFVIAAGWYLISVGLSAGRREQLSAAFDGRTVGDAMRATPEAVSGNMIVNTMIELYSIGGRIRSMPVELDGRVVGVIGQDEVDNIAPARWASARVRTLMTPIGPADVVDAATPLDDLMVRPAGPTGRVVVVDGDTVVGIIEGADLAQILPDSSETA
ncbi:MAG: M50 family metallopeptidase [Acidimicrobiia bacterium]